MSASKERLLDFEGPDDLPSKLISQQIVDDFLCHRAPLAQGFPNILDRFDDHGYSPNLEQIKNWIDKESTSFVAAVLSNNDWPADGSVLGTGITTEQFFDRLSLAKENASAMEALIKDLAKSFEWMDRNPFWGGTPMEAYWHGVKAQSALLQVEDRLGRIIDFFYEMLQRVLSSTIDATERALLGQGPDTDLANLTNEADTTVKKISALQHDVREIIDLAISMGFLFRDAWWLEEHGDAAIRGYIARETSLKAGESGGKSSSTAKRERIEAFLNAHALMMSRNPILADDPSEELAFRALKLARRETPKLFGKANSKRTAVEYWDYIKADPQLWKQYLNKLNKHRSLT